jgi:hypothetical protein
MDRGQTPELVLEGHLENVVEATLPHLDDEAGAEAGVLEPIPDAIARTTVHERGKPCWCVLPSCIHERRHLRGCGLYLMR